MAKRKKRAARKSKKKLKEFQGSLKKKLKNL